MNGFDGRTEQGLALDVYSLSANTWSTKSWAAGEGPSPRSVCTLLPVKISGRAYPVTMFDESDPSNAGHMGAEKMLSDVWADDVEAEEWQQVETRIEGGGQSPAPRGWFAADVLPNCKRNRVLVQGGLGESNERLGDVWVLALA